MWEIWMPYVRNIVAQWQPRNCGSMVDFLDSWVHVVPVWILDNILDQLIFPRLQKEVRWESCAGMQPCSEAVFQFQPATTSKTPACCLVSVFRNWGVTLQLFLYLARLAANGWTYEFSSVFCLQVENWNPLTDTVPIHSWIHPWLPLMQARLEPLYSPIRNKLANALQKWHPSDSSAKLILQPWKDVFTPGSWEAFMVKNIVPKLGETGQTALNS